MASGDAVTPLTGIQKIQDDIFRLWTIFQNQPEVSDEQNNFIKALYEYVARSLRTPVTADKAPLLRHERKIGTNWEYSSNLTGLSISACSIRSLPPVPPSKT
jgi:hypothetical protein